MVTSFCPGDQVAVVSLNDDAPVWGQDLDQHPIVGWAAHGRVCLVVCAEPHRSTVLVSGDAGRLPLFGWIDNGHLRSLGDDEGDTP